MPECSLCVTVKSVSFALFSAGSQWTAGLEEPQHRQSSSPSLSSHSWNPLLLNNELNLSLASRGGLRTTLSLAEGFVAHVHVRTHRRAHACTFLLSLSPSTSSCVKTAPLIGSRAEKNRENCRVGIVMEEEDREAVRRRSRCARLRELEEYNSSFRAVSTPRTFEGSRQVLLLRNGKMDRKRRGSSCVVVRT